MSFAELTRQRYSCRHYAAAPVEADKLAAILEAGRIAPSACNNHPTRVIVCDTPELLAKAAAAAHHFARPIEGTEDQSVFGAPLVLVVCEKPEVAWTRKYDAHSAADIDSAIVVDQMMMQATELGLGTCWVCHFDPAIAREQFELPEDTYPISMLAVGYATDEIAAPDAREARCIPMAQFTDVTA